MVTQHHRDFKNDLFEQFARVGKALASGRRLEMVELLAQRERSVEELARMSGLSVANASQHLQVLRGAGLVETRKEGLHVHYRLAGAEVFQLWQSLRRVGEERVAEIDRMVRSFRTDRDSLEAVSLKELQRKLKDGTVILLDVRPADEFADGHIAGARNVPLAELKAQLKMHLKSFPKAREIIAYCRGPYCVLSDDAVSVLRANGRQAFRLAEGFPDWKALGLRVEPASTGGSTR